VFPVADKEQVARLRKDLAAWNDWRRDSEQFLDLSHADLHGVDLSSADLSDADLSAANLSGANLSSAHLSGAQLGGTDLREANLHEAYLRKTRLSRADLTCADLSGAYLSDADLRRAKLRGADLREAYLHRANLRSADLMEANLSRATLYETLFANVDLSVATGLETCRHFGPSVIDFRTLTKSSPLPLVFLQGIGLPDNVIDYLPSLLSQPIQYYSCFISYSSMDDDFAKRIHVDLQSKGIRCWFAPHDLIIGGKILDEIDAAIRRWDKVLLILSEHSIGSDWVEDEVKTAYEEERTRKQTVLFPVRLDDAVMKTKEAWAARLRDRHIGDFRQWKNHDRYSEAFERVLRDLAGPKKSA
jgi:TIR domain/Pentapeptide repeats (8 copies)